MIGVWLDAVMRWTLDNEDIGILLFGGLAGFVMGTTAHDLGTKFFEWAEGLGKGPG